MNYELRVKSLLPRLIMLRDYLRASVLEHLRIINYELIIMN